MTKNNQIVFRLNEKRKLQLDNFIKSVCYVRNKKLSNFGSRQEFLEFILSCILNMSSEQWLFFMQVYDPKRK